MCGICGIFDPLHKLAPGQIESDVPAMMRAIEYRGPDENGTRFDAAAGLGLGHLRLSIIDLAGGHQPMSNADGSLSIVFNGEIYNYEEERKALAASGYAFKTHSDTEVILALYERYGVEAWPRLRGQFAFGLWDSREKALYLVRDRLGEKPLIYSYHNQVLYFASELKAILRCRDVPHELDRSVLGLHLLMQHLPPPFTLMRGVQKLPPGHYLRATASGIELVPYWLLKTTAGHPGLSEDQLIEQFRSLFQEAVRLCTVSDVPIGTFLSGGLDSTSVTWAATQVQKAPLHSFAIFNRQDHEKHPDWKYAQEAAAALHTQHHNVFYELSDLMKLIPEFVDKTDEPFQGATTLVSLYLSKFTREHVKVVLTGSGGDELLGGYQAYYRQVLRSQNAWQTMDCWVPPGVRTRAGSVLKRLHPALGRLGLPSEERRIAANMDYHARWLDLLCPGQKDVTRQRFIETLHLHHIEDHPNYFKRYLWEDLSIDHAHSITTLPDATGMACSLEARNPFLDYRLVEFLMNVDPQLLIRNTFQNKYLLVKAMSGRVPDSILFRPKIGFSGMTEEQLVNWTRSEGRAMFRDYVLDSKLVKDGYIPRAGLEQLCRRYETTPSTSAAAPDLVPIWTTTMLALWYDRQRGDS